MMTLGTGNQEEFITVENELLKILKKKLFLNLTI